MGVPRGVYMEEVESSRVHSIGHNPMTNDMFVRFKSGGLYRYVAVPEQVFEEFKRGVPPNEDEEYSVGKYFNRCIIGRYKSEKIPEPKTES